jgi:hypothetical protein
MVVNIWDTISDNVVLRPLALLQWSSLKVVLIPPPPTPSPIVGNSLFLTEWYLSFFALGHASPSSPTFEGRFGSGFLHGKGNLLLIHT